MGKKIVLSSQSRVYLIAGRARGDHKPSYESCMRMTGLSQDFGDIERVECPDPYRYGAFVEVAQIRGATGRVTTSLEGRFLMDVKSTLMDLASKGCPVDIHLHFGDCQDPSVFNSYEKVLILEDAFLINHGTDDLGALQSGDNAGVNETADISASIKYEIMPLGYGVKAGDIVTNEVVDVEICDVASCGECQDSSSGCDKFFAISSSAGGSPSPPADVVYSIDKGATWYAHDIESLGAAEDPNELACVGDYLIVVSSDSVSLHYSLKSQYDGHTDPTWTEVATGFVDGPTCIYTDGNVAYIGGINGYIYYTEDPTSGVTVLDAATLFATTYNAIHGIGDSFVILVGNHGAIAYSTNGVTFTSSPTSPVGVGTHLTAVWAKSESEWWVGTSGGRLYYTLNGGETWTEKAFSSSGTGGIGDIKFATDSEGFLAHNVTSPASRGRILRTIDGGYSWFITPEKAGSLPAQDRLNALAVCASDQNFVVGAGLADNASDGVILVGQSG